MKQMILSLMTLLLVVTVAAQPQRSKADVKKEKEQAGAIPSSGQTQVHVDERFELTSIAFRLTGIDVFAYPVPQNYVSDFINIIGNSEPHIQCNPYLTLIHHIKGIWTKYPQEIIKKNNFVCNFSHYEEALTHNVGLNRKITIDYNGDLKNFYSHSLIFGNVIDMPISDVIDNKLFQIKWDISNDHIRKCKDCQYRYMCLSNSDLNYENGMYEKKDNCQFDPYSNKWE